MTFKFVSRVLAVHIGLREVVVGIHVGDIELWAGKK